MSTAFLIIVSAKRRRPLPRPRIWNQWPLTCKQSLAYSHASDRLPMASMTEHRRDTDLLFKALADPSRRKLLDVLHAHDGRSLSRIMHQAMRFRTCFGQAHAGAPTI